MQKKFLGLLRLLWISVATLLVMLLLGRFLVSVVHFSGPQVLLQLFGITALFYSLFLLEGLQIAGLQLKEQADDAIEDFLKSTARSREIPQMLRMTRLFRDSFPAFLAGRQILVIMTVVSMATLLGAQAQDMGYLREYLQGFLGTGPAALLAAWVYHPFSTFLIATLLPAWISQLLPQFAADNRALAFAAMPAGEWITRLSIRLDWLEAGHPARVLLKALQGRDRFNDTDNIQIGRERFYDTAVNYYGRARERYRLFIQLGEKTSYKEDILYRFRRSSRPELFHKIKLMHPIRSGLEVRVQTPDGVELIRPRVTVMERSGEWTYTLSIPLSHSLPMPHHDNETLSLSLSYETDEDSRMALEDGRWVEFTSALPVGEGSIQVQAAEGNTLNNPVLEIIDSERDTDTVLRDKELRNTCSIHDVNGSGLRVDMQYPMVGFIYRVCFKQVATGESS